MTFAFRQTVAALVGAATGLAMLAAGAAHAETITLKVADSFPPNHNIANQGTKWWMERVTELTGGKVQFEYYGAQQLGKLSDMLALAQRKVAEITYVPPTFNEGRMPLSTVHNLPGLFDKSYVGTLAYYDTIMNTAILENDYLRNGVYPLWGVMTTTYNVFTRDKAVRSLADLEGMKLKTAGGYQNEAVKLLGGVPLNIPSPETYQAIQLGTVDGAIFPSSAAKSYRLPEVAKFYTLGFNVSVFYAPYVMNLEVWKGLPDDVKAAFEQANRETRERMGKIFDDGDAELMEGYKAAGVEIITLPEAEQAKVQARLAPLFDTWAADMKGRGLPGEETLAYFRKAIAGVSKN
ncbi:MAG: TRAP transporter substrate-binding protein DctP [Alphaproteobacteria bacterium]|nr:TRAP transporter substrate-binding protein DctP [Alphaproteobacteria bacterium]MDX5369652.1 TRAP transporter substrate-binding protein DctP [Alphaproteobacteria bacterium]MDX5464287.1 TRAP transporter substrate-binding protein DctP [Alphaproteobacteria bacterium]